MVNQKFFDCLVLYGGDSAERSISLKSAEFIFTILEDNKIPYLSFDTKNDWKLIDSLYSESECVLLILHGTDGEDGKIQAKLESIGAKYLGSDSRSSADCFDKIFTHKKLESSGVKMPRYVQVNSRNFSKHIIHFKKGFVLKPLKEGSSIGTLIVRDSSKFDYTVVKKLFLEYDEMLLEELIEGYEVTCAVFDGEPLPPILIEPPENQEFDLLNKYNGKSQEICPIPKEILNKSQQELIQKIALSVHNIMGSRHLSRTDMMINHDGDIYVLEINTLPGMTKQSLLPKAARVSGLNDKQFINQLIAMAKE